MSQFLVTTPGASATRWVSFALACHPDVYVTHGKFALDSVNGHRLNEEREQGDHGSLTRGNELKEFYASRTLSQIFSAYRGVAPKATRHGNVHTFTVHELLQREAAGESLDGISIVNLTRHPIGFVESHVALVRSGMAQPDLNAHYRQVYRDAVAFCPEVLLVACDQPELALAFVVSCYGVRQAALDLANGRWRNVRMEDVTTDPQALAAFCRQVTGLDYPMARLEQMIQAGPINSHRAKPRKVDPADAWREWSNWQRDVFSLFVTRQMLDLWSSAGYDVQSLMSQPITCSTTSPATTLGDFSEQLGLRQERPSTELVEEGYHGFNLLTAGKDALALSQSLGAMDWRTVDRKTQTAWERDGLCLRAPTVECLKEILMSRPPVMTDSHAGYNVLAWRGGYVGLAQSVGAIDLLQTSDAELQQLENQGNLVRGRSVEDVRQRIDDESIAASPHRILIEPGFHGFDLYELRGRYVALASVLQGTGVQRQRGLSAGLLFIEDDVDLLRAKVIERQAGTISLGAFHGVRIGKDDEQYVALLPWLCEADWQNADESRRNAWVRAFQACRSHDWQEVRDWAAQNTTQTETRDLYGYRVVRYRNHFVALDESLGNVDLTRRSFEELLAWRDSRRMIVAPSREGLWDELRTVHRPQALPNLRHWSVTKFLNRYLALEDLDLTDCLAASEDQLREWQDAGKCIVVDSLTRIHEAITLQLPVRQVETGFHGFNLVEFRGQCLALSEALGPVDLPLVSAAQFAEWEATGQAIRTSVLEELWLEVLFQEPRLLAEGIEGFNIVSYRGRIHGVPCCLGNVHLPELTAETKARWGELGQWVEGTSVEEVRQGILRQSRRWLATDRFGWDRFAWGGRQWAVRHRELGCAVEEVTQDRLEQLAARGHCLSATSYEALDVLCLERRAAELSGALDHQTASCRSLERRLGMKLERGARRIVRLPRRLASASWRTIKTFVFQL